LKTRESSGLLSKKRGLISRRKLELREKLPMQVLLCLEKEVHP